MIVFLLGGIILAGCLLLLLNWWAEADVATAKRGLFWLIMLVCLGLAGILIAAGRGMLAVVPVVFAAARMFGPGLITSWFARRFREREAYHKSGQARQQGTMSREEALDVLGLGEEASPSDVREAYRRLMAQMHPDKGGSDWMAAKLNEARKTLLDKK